MLGVTTVAGNQLLPGLVALVDDLGSVSFVLGLAGEGKLVLGLSIRDFVDLPKESTVRCASSCVGNLKRHTLNHSLPALDVSLKSIAVKSEITHWP